MKRLVGWAVFFLSPVTGEYELDKVFLNKESALEQEARLKKWSFETEIEKTYVMIEDCEEELD